MEDRKTLGRIIKEKREELKMSQRDLAEAIHMNHATICRLETKPDIISDPKTLKQISEVLNIDYNYLLTLNGSIDDEPEIRIISRAAKNMTPEMKKQMLQTLRQFYNEAFQNTENDIPEGKKNV